MGREIIHLRVDEILTERGMTKAELASKMGVQKSYLYNVLGKSKALSLNALISIAEALGYDDLAPIFVQPKADNRALDALKRLFASEISFPADASPRIVGSLLDALKESMSDKDWKAFLDEYTRGILTEPLFEKSRRFMKAETAEDVEAVV